MGTDDPFDGLIDHQRFWLYGPPYFLSVTDPSAGVAASKIVRHGFAFEDGRAGVAVPLFTDRDLAQRFAEAMEGERVALFSFAPADMGEFEKLLRRLVLSGATHVSIDPGPDPERHSRIPASVILDAIRGRADRPAD